MRKFIVALLFVLLLISPASALYWSNGGGGGGAVTICTVATLPGAPSDGDLALVTDGSTANDCKTGLGSTLNLCTYDAGAVEWTIVGDGTGGAGTGSVTTIEEGDVQVGGADIVYLDFGTGFSLTESPDTEVNISLDVTPDSGNATLVVEQDAVQVKYDTTDFGESASGLTLGASPTIATSLTVGGGGTVITDATITDDGNLEIVATTEVQITGGDILVVGEADTAFGTIKARGHATSSVEGGYVRLDTAADHDTTINLYGFKATSDDLYIGPDTDTDALKYDGGNTQWDVTGNITFSGGIVADVTITDATPAVTLADSTASVAGTADFKADAFTDAQDSIMRFYVDDSGGEDQLYMEA